MKYVLLFCGTREQQQTWEKMSEEAQNAQLAQAGRWFAENRAKIDPHNQLHLPHTATTVHFQAGGESVVHDGPFIEGNEARLYPNHAVKARVSTRRSKSARGISMTSC